MKYLCFSDTVAVPVLCGVSMARASLPFHFMQAFGLCSCSLRTAIPGLPILCFRTQISTFSAPFSTFSSTEVLSSFCLVGSPRRCLAPGQPRKKLLLLCPCKKLRSSQWQGWTWSLWTKGRAKGALQGVGARWCIWNAARSQELCTSCPWWNTTSALTVERCSRQTSQ